MLNYIINPAFQARAARAQVEAALDAAGWPWCQRLSLWLDGLILIEEPSP